MMSFKTGFLQNLIVYICQNTQPFTNILKPYDKSEKSLLRKNWPKKELLFGFPSDLA